jgi:acetyl-CoA carboxylase biotin carboxyl carrier protein
MFKFDEMCELIRLVASSRVAGVEVEHGGSRIRIDGVPVVSVAEVPAAATAVPQMPAPSPEGSTDVDGQSVDTTPEGEELHYVTSPIVGTFYRAPNPDAEPYVKVGALVSEGQTLCIVEAMKLMNEIDCDVDGTIVKVLPENAQPVEYGERLFAVRPA